MNRNDEWYVFGSYEPLGKPRLRERKNKDCKLVGVKQVRIHDLTHSCASLLINNGADITWLLSIWDILKLMKP